MEVKYVKVLILFGLLLVSFVIGFIPVHSVWRLRRRSSETSRWYPRIISILSCFAGGVFLATCLMDLLPEIREELEDVLKDSHTFEHYPLAEFITILGLMLMLSIEQGVIVFQEQYSGLSLARESHYNRTFTDVDEKIIEDTRLVEEGQISYKTFESDRTGSDKTDNSRQKDFENSLSLSVRTSETNKSTFRSILLLIALSLHSLFEGLAVGLQDETSEVINVFIGLVIHKAVLAFSLGMTLTQSKLTYYGSIRSLLAFAIASPIGIAIGLIITEYGSGSSSDIAVGVLQGIACGTFLYVTFFEILQHELCNSDIRLVKVIFLFIGFLCMSGLFLLHEHDEH